MPNQLASLAAALRENKTTLIARWLASVSELPGAAHLDGPALRDHIPQFIEEMIAAIARHENLVANAVKFAPAGEIEIGAREGTNGVECWVRDNGSGIPTDRMERIFEKWETDPDPSRAGTGFGLAILKQIVEAHGGAISVESLPGRGSSFHFTIPSPPRE